MEQNTKLCVISLSPPFPYIYIQLPSSNLVPDGGFGRAANIVTSMTVARSDGDEIGKDNSSRAEGVLEFVGFKHIYYLLVTSKIQNTSKITQCWKSTLGDNKKIIYLHWSSNQQQPVLASRLSNRCKSIKCPGRSLLPVDMWLCQHQCGNDIVAICQIHHRVGPLGRRLRFLDKRYSKIPP